MIIILASWIIIWVNCYLFGFVLNKLIFKQKAISITVIIGIIAITFLSNIASFFGPLDHSFLFNITFISCFYLFMYFTLNRHRHRPNGCPALSPLYLQLWVFFCYNFIPLWYSIVLMNHCKRNTCTRFNNITIHNRCRF